MDVFRYYMVDYMMLSLVLRKHVDSVGTLYAPVFFFNKLQSLGHSIGLTH